MQRKLRRGAILVLVAVLLITHTVEALASIPKEPTVIVNSYGMLYSEIAQAKSGDVIGVRGVITIPSRVTLDAGYRDIEIRRMEADAKLVFVGDPDASIEVNIKSLIFNGNAPWEGGSEPFLEVNGTARFSGCTFYDCYNGEGGAGAAMYIASGNVTLSKCDFMSNSARNGSHIYNNSSGVLQIENCTFSDGWTDDEGGAIYLSDTVGATYIRGSIITSNHARLGGGICSYSYLNISDTLVYRNEATRQGADIASMGDMDISDTAETYARLLSKEGLYFVGWKDDTNPSVGGSGEYLKFEVSEEEPTPPINPDPEEDSGNIGDGEGGEPTEPEEPTDPSNPDEGSDTGDTGGGDPSQPTDPDPSNPEEPTDPEDPSNPEPSEPVEPIDPENGGDAEEPTEPVDPSQPEEGANEGGDNPTDPQEPADPDTGGENEPPEDEGGTTDPDPSEPPTDTEDTGNEGGGVEDETGGSTDQDPEPSPPSDANSGSGGNIDNSSTDNSYTDNRVSTTNNSSSDNSSSRSDSSRQTENSNNTTNTYNYYQQEADKGSTEAPSGSVSWVEYATLILLAVLVFGELRDRFKRTA